MLSVHSGVTVSAQLSSACETVAGTIVTLSSSTRSGVVLYYVGKLVTSCDISGGCKTCRTPKSWLVRVWVCIYLGPG